MIDLAAVILAFTLGLFSTLHCLGMCGGIASALACSTLPSVDFDGGRRHGYVLLFNLGRISVYGLLGLVAGVTGAAVFENLDPMIWRRTASAVAGISLILTGLYLGGWATFVRRIDFLGRSLWRKIEPAGRRFLPVRTPTAALATGLVWGWLPCGLVYYSLLIAAPLGNAASGALFMLAFGLGTVPGMYATGVFGGLMIRLTRNRQVRRIASGTILLIGIATLLLGQTDIPHRFMPVDAGLEGAHYDHRH